MFNRRPFLALLGLLASSLGRRVAPAFDTGLPLPPFASVTPEGVARRRTTHFPPERRNGERECARRRRQMAHARQRQADLIARSLGARSFE